jgi:hypothetical protein
VTDAERLAGLEEHANNLEQELDAARAELANRRWPRVLRGGLPPGPNFLQLDDRELTGLLADCQDAHQEEHEHNHRLHVALTRAEMQLAERDARIRELEAALSAAGAERDEDEPPGPHPPG